MLSVVRPLAGLVVAASLLGAPSLFAQTAADTTALDARNVSGVSLLHLRPDAGLTAFGTAEVGTVPARGAGVRMMWYPGKYAFRAGYVNSFGATYWDEANVGYGSAAFGDNTRASGANSFAANLATTASGDESVAFGNNATASGNRAFAFNGTASAVGAVAIGSGAQATSDDALAMGPSSYAQGLASVAIGPSKAQGAFAVAIGLQNNANGNFSVTIGKNARAGWRQGAIVLGDGCAGFSSDSVYATANNQFVARGCGGINFYTSRNLSSGVQVAAGGSSWSAVSDRNRKHGFTDVDGEELLGQLTQVPVTRWHYNAQGDSVWHMGAMAQDFYAAFGLGEDSLRISTIDMDGVTLRGVQALAVRTESLSGTADVLSVELDATRAVVARQADELRALRADLAALRAARDEDVRATAALAERLAHLEALLTASPKP